jgi:O-antigen/teichoic acid export membrane protein
VNLTKFAGFAVGPIGVAAVSLISVPLTAWYFSAEDIGKISMLQIGISFCLLLFSLGLDQAYVREYHEAINKVELFRACLLPGLIALVATLCGLMLLAPAALSSWLFDADMPVYSLLIAVSISAAFAGRFFSLILRMEERGWAFSISQLMPKVAFLLVLGWFVFNKDCGLVQLLIAHAIAFTSVVMLFAWNTRTQWWVSVGSISSSKRRELLLFGLPLVISGVAFWGMTSLDRVFLKNYSTYEELGLYAVINSFAGVAVVLQNIFTTIWAPTVYKWHAEGVDSIQFQKVVDRVLLVVVTVLSVAGMMSWLLRYLLPAEYQNGQYILMGCLIYPLLYSLSETTGVGLGISRKSAWSMLCMLVALLVNIFFNYMLVPIYGAAGAATATGLSFLALFILRTELSNRCWVRLPRRGLYILVLSSTAMAIGHCLYGSLIGGYIFLGWSIVLVISALRLRALTLNH